MSNLLQRIRDTYRSEGPSYLLKEIYLTSRCKTVSRVEDANRAYNQWQSGAKYNTNGIDIFEENWDNLVILDACRYDWFAELHDFSGNLESRTSRASKTWEFIRANFQGKVRYDTVYLSDNPWYSKLAEKLGSQLYHHELMDQDSFNDTVTHPETATDAAIEYADRFDNKRCIVHYYQPHEPYFTEDGSELHRMETTCPARLHHRGYTRDDMIRAYKSTLRLVLQEVHRLLDHLSGKTVITADHGELFGERMWPIPLRTYEHPEGIYVDELVQIPWFVVDYDERRKIIEADEPAEVRERDEDEIEEQLESLGYL